MKARPFLLFLWLWFTFSLQAQQGPEVTTVAPGVVKLTFGKPDPFAPYNFCSGKPRVEAMKQLSTTALPFDLKKVEVQKNGRGVQVRNQFMIGQNLLAAPTTRDSASRTIYFPEGLWYDDYTKRPYQGGQSYFVAIPADRLPLFVKAGSIIPVAAPMEFVDEKTVFNITCNVFGNNPAPFTLIEDDGITYDFQKGQLNTVVLSVENRKGKMERKGTFSGRRYLVNKWEFFP